MSRPNTPLPDLVSHLAACTTCAQAFAADAGPLCRAGAALRDSLTTGEGAALCGAVDAVLRFATDANTLRARMSYRGEP